jgi:hypothetical protein
MSPRRCRPARLRLAVDGSMPSRSAKTADMTADDLVRS